MKKVAIFGNRNITDEVLIKSKFSEFLSAKEVEEDIVILHGGAAGPAKVLSEYANDDPEWSSILFKPWTMLGAFLTGRAPENEVGH